MKTISPAERRALRAKAHHLEPVVMIGNAGLTPAVLREIDLSLLAHELIKVRVLGDDREAREAMLARICEELKAVPVQHIGKLLLIYRERPADAEAPAAPAEPPVRKKSPRALQQEELIASRRRPRPQLPPKAPMSRPRSRGR
jgi:putative YhbY family RNA-binding protein